MSFWCDLISIERYRDTTQTTPPHVMEIPRTRAHTVCQTPRTIPALVNSQDDVVAFGSRFWCGWFSHWTGHGIT